MADDYKQTFVRLRSKTTGEWFVHPELRQRVMDDAAGRGVTVNEVILQILCQRNGVPYEAKPMRDSDPDPTYFNFRVPLPLLLVLNARAAGKQVQDVVRQDLCGHYGLGMPVPQKRTRHRRSSAAA